jgi:2-keto-3-deoxy-L-rhamnonate aldolase RhmA
MANKTLLEKLKNGKTVYGTCITSMAPLWSKAARNAGLDFVFLDTEHVPLERMEIASLSQLYKAVGISPIVRIPSPDPFRACQMLDAGAEGIVAPYIETVEQVKEMVGALKFRPLKGKRLHKALENRLTVEPELAQYLENYNRGNLCIINIESIPALENLDKLLKVPGLDGVFIGPHDLSVNMGLPEKYDHPDFEKMVATIIKKCVENNIAVGIHFSESPERQVKWMNAGANIIIHSSDIAIFSQKLAHDIQLIRKSGGDESDSSDEKIII